MVKIDYDRSVGRLVDGASAVVLEIEGEYEEDDFRLVLTSSHLNYKNDIVCERGLLNRTQIEDVLCNFDINKCNTEFVLL